MKKAQKFKKSIILAIGAVLSSMAIAAEPTSAVTCPTALKPSDMFFSMPYGFDKKKQTVSYAAIDGMREADHRWLTIVYPVPVGQLENNRDRVKAVMEELVPVSNAALSWSMEEEVVNYCIYTHPSLKEVTAVVFYDDEVDYDEDDWDMMMKASKKKKTKHQKIMLAARQFLK